MSLPISQLLTLIGDNKKIKPPENVLYNPDIPVKLDDEITIRDQYSNMRINTPFNGGELPLKESGVMARMDPKKKDFQTTNAIDPNTIRSKIDPDSAMPTLDRYSLFSLMPSSVAPPYDQVALIRKSAEAYSAFQNRFKSTEEKQKNIYASAYQNTSKKIPDLMEPRANLKPNPPPYTPSDAPQPAQPEPPYDIINQDAMIPTEDILPPVSTTSPIKSPAVDPNDISTWPIFSEDPQA